MQYHIKKKKDYYKSRTCGIMGNDKIKEDDNNTIGMNIIRLWKERGFVQTELENVSMTRETLVKIERGIQHI